MSSGAQGKQAKAAEAVQHLSVRELSAAERGVLRFITCGSVDDGKSTLIGRLLYDTKLLFEDQLAALERDSARHGTQGANMDFALLLDGLEAEREQGITIDVAYRYFATDKRKFIVADTPGHEQYTRNMATGASTADAAVILVDARKGVLTQTRRHTFITHMVGVRHIVLAVNKMDLVEDRQGEFDRIVAEYRSIADKLGFESVQAIPISALNGDNVIARSEGMSWYDGPSLLTYLEDLGGGDTQSDAPFRMPVQWVNRPNLDFRGFSGQVTSGAIAPGDEVVVARSGRPSRIKEISTADGPLEHAEAGAAVTLVLEDEIDISRGDVLARPDSRPEVSSHFAARVLWMHEDGMAAGRSYLMKVGAQVVQATLKKIQHRIDVNTMDETEADALELNEIGLCELTTNQPIVFDPYEQIRESGAFILVDRYSNQTVGAGMIDRSLARASNVHQHAMDVTQADRARAYGHRPAILWFTGLSGSGKSTIANLVERRLSQLGAHTYALDGDNMRGGLNKDLGFTDADRAENIRRVGEVARLFVDAGTIVTASFISPFRSERELVRSLVKEGEYIEIFVDTPITVCAQRDPKGLYKKAMAGEIKNFTGIDSPYEPPENPELILETTQEPPEASVDKVIGFLRERGMLSMDAGGTVGFSI